MNASLAWRTVPARAGPGFSPPELVVQVKALACELPRALGLPLSRFSSAAIAHYARTCGLVATLSGTTVWRWLNEDAIRPWQHRCWVFPRDPDFARKADRVLDLYARRWRRAPLRPNEFVLSADEKTSIQARHRCHPTRAPGAGQAMRVEHEYQRAGAWAYLAALDVHRCRLFGRCETTTGIAPFERLVDDVMTTPPYRTARRVFWIVDNGSSHRGQRAADRLRQRYPNLFLVHTPVHASWLNQIEIYFSILQRKALTPNDFHSLADVKRQLLSFQHYFESIASPFEWKFTKRDLRALLQKLQPPSPARSLAA